MFVVSLVLTLVYYTFLQEQLHRKVAFQAWFCKVAGENRKKLLPEIFLSYQKRISPIDIFILLKLSRSVRLCREKNNNTARNASKSDTLTLFTLLNADAKSAVILRVPSSTKVEGCSFSSLHFPKWLCLIHGYVSAKCGKAGDM